ncbi:uncharacterized protein LOC107274870 [Cephus cinctus]|uniref:Uncharacterized protein LOC107274870 n=1 Tax=Cephus cinctus TaxID=211228 RepID=A0AAJ7FV81_CEPCN|nr:uncharacterized protein LOC107274870 [Cephus cinctus]
MPRERRENGNKKGKRQRYIQNNDETQSRSKKNVKSSQITRTNRFSPFVRAERHSRRDVTMDDNIGFFQARDLHAKSKEIIERGMEYILFHLQLIQMSIWGSNRVSDNKKTLKETEQAEGGQVAEAVDAITSETRLLFEKEKYFEDSEGDMFTAVEDSDDSSSDHWSSANDFVNMNMSIDLESEYEDVLMNSRIVIEEPMDISIDISMEESSPRRRIELVSFSKSGSQEAKRCSRDTTPCDSSEDDDESSLGVSDRDSDREESSSAANEEITKILKKRNSSDNDKYSLFREEEHGRRNFPYFRDYASSEDTSVSGTDSLSDRQEVRNSQRDASARRIIPCCCCLSPRKREEHRRSIVKNYINFEVMNNQVDSAFSEDDVEMSALERSVLKAHLNEKLSNRRNGKDIEIMDQDTTLQGEALSLLDRNPTVLKKSLKDVSSEHYDNSSRSTNRHSECGNTYTPGVKAPTVSVKRPPGFPNLPQNLPPLFCSCGNPECFILLGNEIGKSKIIYQNAPRPLRHLYYQYPEFMEPLTPYHNSPSW